MMAIASKRRIAQPSINLAFLLGLGVAWEGRTLAENVNQCCEVVSRLFSFSGLWNKSAVLCPATSFGYVSHTLSQDRCVEDPIEVK
jgi:hypothetical protein